MATSSIHIATGGNGYFAHNSRESHTVNAIFDDEQNYCSCTNAEAFETYKAELQKRSDAYTERTGQKLQSKSVTHLSAIVNFNKEHTEKDIQKVCDYLEKKFDTKVIQFAMHRDEGHINENGEKVKNYHAHIEFMGLDSKGNSVRRKLDKKALIELQTQTAKLLKMERGKNYTELKEKRPKRLDTYEFKKAKQMEATKVKDLLATKEQLKTANTQLREFMKSNGANRNDYAQLEKEKKILEEQLKTKVLTEKELLKKFQDLEKQFLKSKNLINELKTEKEDLSNKVTTLEEKIVSSSNMSDLEVKNELQKIINDEIQVEKVKTGVFTTTEKPVIQNQKSFLKRVQDLATQGTQAVKQQFENLKREITQLKSFVKALQKENLELKEKVKQLESEAPKQQEKRNEKALEKLVGDMEVREASESESSLTLKTGKESFKEKLKRVQEEVKQEKKQEEITPQKREITRSR